jgi:hypothetical protein
MVLSKQSWHFGLHQLLYGRNAKMPKNFCPYFWKTIVPGCLFIVPLTILVIPMYLAELALRKKDEGPPKIKDEGYFSSFFFVMLVVDLALIALYGMVAIWFTKFVNGNANFIQVMGMLGYGLVAIALFFYLRSLWIDRRKARREKRHAELRAQGKNPYTYREYKEPEPNVFIEFIKAWYKKNCPLIQWKE